MARLITNLSAQLKKNPKDAEAAYRLGRVHYFAFTSPEKPKYPDAKPAIVGLYGDEEGTFGFDTAFGGDDPGHSKAPGPEFYVRTHKQQIEHVRLAVSYLQQALAGMKPTTKPDYERYLSQPGLVSLCLACALEDGAKYAPEVGQLGSLMPTKQAWTNAALDAYTSAYNAAVKRDLDQKHKMFGKLVSQEAGIGVTRILKSRKVINGVQEQLLDKIKASNALIEKFPQAITPIVISLQPSSGLSELIHPTRSTAFDIAGTGSKKMGTWVNTETGLLCWDPERNGRITSGTQLFGNATWWMFWSNGYEALAALDDNHDGWLTGKELKGLSLWFDKNQNATCDAGETLTLQQLDIVGLRTSFESSGTLGLTSASGVLFSNGQTLPSYDWVVSASR